MSDERLPDIYKVRIAQQAKDLSCPLVLLMPGNPAPDVGAHDPRTVFIDLTPPDMTPYHVCLGRFMNDWGRLEVALHGLFAEMLGVDAGTASAISRQFSGKSLREVIESLSSHVLSDSKHRELVNLGERFGGLSSKRNKIVHGFWVIEVIVTDGKPGKGSKVRIDTVRQYASISSATEKLLADVTQQKLRCQNLFNIAAINETGRDAISLAGDVSRFADAIGKAPRPEPDGPQSQGIPC